MLRKLDYRSVAVLVTVVVTMLAFQNCGPSPISSSDQGASNTPARVPTPTPNPNIVPGPHICDPFYKGSPRPGQKQGLVGMVSSTEMQLDAATYCADQECQSSDYVAYGNPAPATLVMSQVFFTGSSINFQGFQFENDFWRNSQGNPIREWYAFDVGSNLVLGANDEPGEYQFAIISDDGASMYVNGLLVVNNEGFHAPQLVCGMQTMNLSAGQELAFRTTFFQGQGGAAMVALWRKVQPGMDLNDCGQSGDGFATPAQLPGDLVARGWKVIAPENFKLTPDNPCL